MGNGGTIALPRLCAQAELAHEVNGSSGQPPDGRADPGKSVARVAVRARHPEQSQAAELAPRTGEPEKNWRWRTAKEMRAHCGLSSGGKCFCLGQMECSPHRARSRGVQVQSKTCASSPLPSGHVGGTPRTLRPKRAPLSSSVLRKAIACGRPGSATSTVP